MGRSSLSSRQGSLELPGSGELQSEPAAKLTACTVERSDWTPWLSRGQKSQQSESGSAHSDIEFTAVWCAAMFARRPCPGALRSGGHCVGLGSAQIGSESMLMGVSSRCGLFWTDAPPCCASSY